LNFYFQKTSNIEFHENPSSGSELFYLDGQTDRHDKAKSSFANMQMHLKTTIQYQAFTYILLLSKDHFTMPLSVNCHINLHTTGKVYHSLDKRDA
jgi:hypothetical protein